MRVRLSDKDVNLVTAAIIAVGVGGYFFGAYFNSHVCPAPVECEHPAPVKIELQSKPYVH